ncbi:MAG: cysteine--tRNA ligase [Candidatus Phytoplasma stylosanthis]|uniref:cysteine--tRNA ligase n=1 Tax=Candidatus Phytoplasma stylosanthis TaxID=2798314 RepID=UPI00293B3440|nr:cysteine--tRNA ligase [Candidatus Phytoplasma stylosanthis]MDV3167782.1 cysteine--tRNA ligase [Candidatus Phytoplasma stylosanthis]MDV3170941.1 cysteine--tRNA ligase [Candidatus Phytoplasma stylosanthis]MDV3173687.1 cysteine--tRNA ligase [Candidatus Phytoplasma stylosanthis]MDV3174113.1 cysteine--tRNA ligase [Candidatus Phytoplasma stylosanthis]MDV3202367.1 cysteine--tRNA ligase [Candidatus Phytoplasma stylosanthis]
MLKIYNILNGKKELFHSLEEKKVNIYVCGPTVYDHLHIGNIRPLIFFDFVKRYFLLLGMKVNLVVNITDIDDKIIQKAITNKVSETDISKKYTTYFFNLLSFLEIKLIDKFPLVTNYIPEIVSYIERLIKEGYTYTTSEGIYFKSSLVSNYGDLSNQKINKLKKSDRKQKKTDKINVEDFVLWKKTENGIQYKSPWFYGRPGWHTECVTMIQNIFHNTIDIHGGGNDLKFPHHENEKAQFWAINKKTLANYFMYIGYVNYKKNKMSKSLKNVILVKDLLKTFEPNIIKLFFLSYHYLQPIDYNVELIFNFKIKYDRILYILNKNNFKLILHNFNNNEITDSFYIKKFFKLIENDFDTPNILTLIEELLKKINKTLDLNKLSKFQNTLIFLLKNLNIFIVLKDVTKEKIEIYNLWLKTKQNKEFEKSDYLRNILQKEQII